MPYIVTTTNERPSGTEFVSRRAVATLYEAKNAAHEAVHAAYRLSYPVQPRGLGGEHSDAQRAHSRANVSVSQLFEQGGTVGPLPDGTVIEVEQVLWTTLATGGTVAMDDHAGIIDAYNAAQEV